MSVIPTLSRDPYGTALQSLRRLAEERSFAPGESLVITDLAERIGLSPTPVREALARLAGEGLIDRRKGKGYAYPADQAPTLLDLYALQRTYVHAALTLYFAGPSGLQKAAPPIDPSPEPACLFGAVVAQSGNAALVDAHGRVSRRLAEPDRADRRLEPDVGLLFEQMAVAMSEGLRDPLLDMIETHYLDRCSRAWRVARMLGDEGGSPHRD